MRIARTVCSGNQRAARLYIEQTAHMAIAIDIPHTPIVSVQKSYNRSMTTENNKNSRFEMRLT